MIKLESGMDGPSRTFQRIGLPVYWSPEHFGSSGYGFESDLWALGVCLYTMAVGFFPFGDEDDDPFSLGHKIQDHPHRWPSWLISHPKN